MATTGVERFFEYARKRHQIYLKRTAGMKRPWTDDEILNTYRFTNIFRELDRNTVWFKKYVREPLRDDPRVLLATVIFRMTNRIETGEAIFCQGDLFDGSAFAAFCERCDVRTLLRAVKTHCGDGPYVTGGYIISSPPGYSKIEGVMEVIKRFCDKNGGVRKLWADGVPRGFPHTLEGAWQWLGQFEYLGNFHAYEIVTDLRFTRLLDSAPDIMTWANPGPGAHRGANRVFRGDKDAKVSRYQVIEEMRQLLSETRSAAYWPQDDARKHWPAWEMREVEHTLCEFDKYERVRLGEGTPRGKYKMGCER